MLRQGYGRTSTVIASPIDPTRLFPRHAAPEYILWVGKSHEPIKQPSLILRLARELPQHSFVVIMNKTVARTHKERLKEAAELPNVTLIEQVPFGEVERYFADARLHVNTSTLEGFPNTFLQAAKYGVPTISLSVDPGGMLSNHHCGLVAGGEFDRFREAVSGLMGDAQLYAEISRSASKYVASYHDKDVIVPQYEAALLAVLDLAATQ